MSFETSKAHNVGYNLTQAILNDRERYIRSVELPNTRAIH